MIGISVVDTVQGYSSRHFFDDNRWEALVGKHDQFIGLQTYDAVLSSKSRGLFAVYRRLIDQKFVTWIGCYKPVLGRWRSREGDYCGVGIWLNDKVVDGGSVSHLLIDSTTELQRTIQDALDWRTSLLDPRMIGLTEDDFYRLARQERNSDRNLGLGFAETGPTTVIELDERQQIGAALDRAQSARGLGGFAKALIPCDREASAGIRVQTTAAARPSEHRTRALKSMPQPDLPVRTVEFAGADRSEPYQRGTLAGDLDELRIEVGRRFQDTQTRIDRLDRQMKMRGWQPLIAVAAIAISLLSAATIAIGQPKPLAQKPPATIPVTPPEMAPSAPSPPARPSGTDRGWGPNGGQGGNPPPAPGFQPVDDVEPSQAETNDYFRRLEITLTDLVRLSDSPASPDETRRRLRTGLNQLLEQLSARGPNDPKLRPLVERIRRQMSETARPPIRN